MKRPAVYSPPPIERPERRVVWTIAVGDKYKWMFDITIPRIKAMAERIGAEFLCVDDNWRVDEHPCYLKQIINALWWRYDRAWYIDADHVLLDGMPNLFVIAPPGRCAAYRVPDQRRTLEVNTYYLNAYNEQMRLKGLPEVTVPAERMARHYSAGMFLCDKTCNPHRPPVGNVMRVPGDTHYDQSYFNLMINLHDIPMFDLSDKWSRSMRQYNNADFARAAKGAYALHYVGNTKDRMMRDMENVGNPTVRVHIVLHGCRTVWILERMALNLQEHAPPDIKITTGTHALDERGVINFYMPYRCYKQKSQHALDVCFFTHPEIIDKWEQAARECDHAVVMCEQYRDDLIARGVEPGRISLIYPGVDECYRRPRLRVFNPSRMTSNTGYKQRKGYDLWQRVCEMDGVDAVCSDGKMDSGAMMREYQTANVIISTARMEGGPMALLESLALGKPFIMREGVGLAQDFVSSITTYKDDDDLIEKIKRLVSSYREHLADVAGFTWDRYAADHFTMFRKLVDGRGCAPAPPPPPPNTVSVYSGDCSDGIRKECAEYIASKGKRVIESSKDNALLNFETLAKMPTLSRIRAIKKTLENMP